MKYIPEINEQEKEKNHQIFSERRDIYKEKGFDFAAGREFILQKANVLPGNVLEIGTGSGDMTIFLAKAGYEITAVDKDAESLKKSALNLAYENLLSNVTFHVMDAASLDFPKESFNNVFCVNSFHHIQKVDNILSEMDRVLGKNGKLVLADFNEKGMEIVNDVHKAEGRTHENLGIIRDYVYSYFDKLGYSIKRYEESYHWVLICQK